MALGRNHVLAIVAIAGILALALIGAGVLDVTQKTGYVRINVSDKSAIWLEFKGTELRAAASAEGLKTAEPVALRALGNQASESPEFTLPIPADQLPEGIWAVKGSFRRFGNMVLGQLGICRTDEQKVVWQCDVRVTSSTGDTAVAAGTMQLPGLEKTRADCQRQALEREVGRRSAAHGGHQPGERRAQVWKARAGAGQRDGRLRQ